MLHCKILSITEVSVFKPYVTNCLVGRWVKHCVQQWAGENIVYIGSLALFVLGADSGGLAEC